MKDSVDLNILTSIPKHDHTEEVKPVSSEAFDCIIENRRAVRVYTEEKIPETVTQKVLEWGLSAPNSSNLQPWEFYWVKSPEKKKLLVEALLNQSAARTSSELIVAVARLDTWKKHAGQILQDFDQQAEKVPKSARMYYQKLVPLTYNQGPLGLFGLLKKISVTLIGLKKVIPREPTSRADMRVWAVKSTALACENIMLGFSAFGYDSCPMEGYDSARVKQILGLGRNAEVVMCISAGKRASNGVYTKRIRMPKDQFIKIV